jgi:uncharacterized Zn-binding protein involved in type VI secretion
MPPAARIGDPFACGDFVAAGAATVMADGIPLARIGDATTGHQCFNPNMIGESNGSVYAENILVSTVGNSNILHKCGKAKHKSPIVAGSGTVTVE